MKAQLRNPVFVVLILALVLAVVLAIGAGAKAKPEAAADAPSKYTVVNTDGTHLIVTDNSKNKVYFYAIDQGGKPGDELKFRGSIDLADVGKPSITPTKAK